MIKSLFEIVCLGSIGMLVLCVIAKVMALISDHELEWIYYVFILIILLGFILKGLIGGL